MKKILIAMNNDKIYNEIIAMNKYDVFERDIVYKEGVLEYLSQNKVDVIITKDDLEGEIIKELYIKQIKLLNPEIKIIIFVKKIDDKYLEFLYNNEVFDIIEISEGFNKEKIISMIDQKEVVNKQIKNVEYNNDISNKFIKIVTKKKIAVFGTSGSGKSYISSLLTSIITEKLNVKTLLIDLDVQNSAVDIYNNLNCRNNLLMDIVKDVDNQTINNENFENNIYKKGKKYFITNNASIFEYQNNLCMRHYEKIFDMANQIFDVIISDVVGNISLDVTYYTIKNADLLLFVISPNYISIRQAIKYLDLLTNSWNVDKNKIKLVVNKITKNSLTIAQIESLLFDYKIIMEVDYDDNLENVINGISNINNNTLREDKEIYKIFGIEKNEKIKNTRERFIYNFFKREENL